MINTLYAGQTDRDSDTEFNILYPSPPFFLHEDLYRVSLSLSLSHAHTLSLSLCGMVVHKQIYDVIYAVTLTLTLQTK